MARQAKSADDWARFFKLHNCIGNKRFAMQIALIQADVRSVVEQEIKEKQKKP